MARYSRITSYIAPLSSQPSGKWIAHEPTPDAPGRFAWVEYSKTVMAFHKEFGPCFDYDYVGTTRKKNLEFANTSSTYINRIDAPGIIALISAALMADKWSDGALKSLIDNGTFIKWLKRLKYLDEHHDYDDHIHNKRGRR